MPASIRPTVCFGGNPCNIEVIQPGATFVQFLFKCSAHQSIQTINSLTEETLFLSIQQSDRRKEVARWAVKLQTNVEDVSFSVDADGTIHVITGVNGKTKEDLIAQIQLGIVGVPAPLGTVSIVVD